MGWLRTMPPSLDYDGGLFFTNITFNSNQACVFDFVTLQI